MKKEVEGMSHEDVNKELERMEYFIALLKGEKLTEKEINEAIKSTLTNSPEVELSNMDDVGTDILYHYKELYRAVFKKDISQALKQFEENDVYSILQLEHAIINYHFKSI